MDGGRVVRCPDRDGLAAEVARFLQGALAAHPGRFEALAVGDSTLPLYAALDPSDPGWAGRAVMPVDELVPPPGSVERPDFLRWLIFLVANVYPTYTYADEPDRFVPDAAARDSFRATVDAYAQRLYGILEATARAPWFLGDRFSALDIYVAVMTRWRPGRQWFAENAPLLHAIATRADAIAQLQAVWSRNFPEAGS